MGRTNKLVDGCYSYWVGALFPLLATLQQHPYGTRPQQQPTQQPVPTEERASQTGKLSSQTSQTREKPVPTGQTTIPVRQAHPTDRSFGGCEGPVSGGLQEVAAARAAGERVVVPLLPQCIRDASERLCRAGGQHHPPLQAPEVMPRPMWLLN